MTALMAAGLRWLAPRLHKRNFQPHVLPDESEEQSNKQGHLGVGQNATVRRQERKIRRTRIVPKHGDSPFLLHKPGPAWYHRGDVARGFVKPGDGE